MSAGTVIVIIGSGGHRLAGEGDSGTVTVTVDGLRQDAKKENILHALRAAIHQVERGA